MNIAVSARSGVVDDLFVGKFLGRDCMLSISRLPLSLIPRTG